MCIRLFFLNKAVLLLSCATLLLISVSIGYADQLTDTRNIIKEWVNVEKTITTEQKAWREDKALLGDIIASLSAEEKILQETITNAEQDTSRVDEERLELISLREDYQGNSQVLQDRMAQYERQAIQLMPNLPLILQDELGPLVIKLQTAEEANFSLSERTQTLISVLTAIQEFDNRISVNREIRKNDAGEEIEVKVLYVGLSQAFYVNEAETTAGIGQANSNAGERGWNWVEQTELATDILRAINIYENRESPALISLPLQLQTN